MLPEKNIEFIESVKLQLFELNKYEYNKSLLLKIQNKNFDDYEFLKLVDNNNLIKKITINSIIEDNFFTKGKLVFVEIDDFDIKVRVRSSGNFLNAKIQKIDDRKAVIILDQPENAVSPGQACVFYTEDKNGIRLLGGGWIDSTN